MTSIDEVPEKRRSISRRRYRIDKEVQTEASFVPSSVNLNHTYDTMASDSFQQLLSMRKMIQSCMGFLAGDVYDVVTMKDILLQIEDQLPSALPMTDLLLLTSRLFRHMAELGRLVGCFFGVVFAEDHADEHFNFVEVRVLQRELRELKQVLAGSEQERTRLQEMLNNVGQVAFDHGKAVELLETHNTALKMQTSALEDQMALLFHQLHTDLESHCKSAYQQVSGEMELQERLNPTRITFRQAMDSLSEQLHNSRGLITDVRETLLSCTQGGRSGEAYLAVEPSVRFKLKMLDSNFQQLMGRFGAVKNTVVETAQELMGALQERKKILYLSFQHIRLYDLQNSKLRNGRAILAQMQQVTSDFVQRIQATFPTGVLTSVDRFGKISTERWQGGYTLATLRGYKLAQQRQGQDGGDAEHTGREALPGLTQVQIMAAESELAALEGRAYQPPALPRPAQPLLSSPSNEAKKPYASSISMVKQSSKSAKSFELGSRTSISFSGAPHTSAADSEETRSHSVTIVPFDSVQSFLDIIRRIDVDMEELRDSLVLDDEMSAFLTTLTLSASTTARADAPDSGVAAKASQVEHLEYTMEAALQPTGARNTASSSRRSIDSSSGTAIAKSFGTDSPNSHSSIRQAGTPTSPLEGRSISRTEQAQCDAALARQALQLQRQQEQIAKMQDDFSTKIAFLRQVYEARIADLEVKESTVQKKFASVGDFSRPTARSGGGEKSADVVRKGTPRPDAEMKAQKRKVDRDQLLSTRSEWQQTKGKLQPNRMLREATLNELERIREENEQSDDV